MTRSLTLKILSQEEKDEQSCTVCVLKRYYPNYNKSPTFPRDCFRKVLKNDGSFIELDLR